MSPGLVYLLILSRFVLTCMSFTGSRYIYDLYYEKEAISRKLYDWLLKNNYADANLLAKWKKQGYEKVKCHEARLMISRLTRPSCAACGVFRQRRPTSIRPASVACRGTRSKRTRRSSASAAAVEAARAPTKDHVALGQRSRPHKKVRRRVRVSLHVMKKTRLHDLTNNAIMAHNPSPALQSYQVLLTSNPVKGIPTTLPFPSNRTPSLRSISLFFNACLPSSPHSPPKPPILPPVASTR